MLAGSWTGLSAQGKVVKKIIETGTTDNRTMEHADWLANRIGGRIVGSPALTHAEAWVKEQFESWGLDVMVQEAGEINVGFYRGPVKYHNIIGILLVPDTVDINGAGSIDNLVALFLQVGEKFNVVVVQFVIRAEDLQAGRQRYGRDIFELDESGVSVFLRDLLAVLDVNVLRLVAAMLDGVAVTRFRAFAAQTGHLRADYLTAEAAKIFCN